MTDTTYEPSPWEPIADHVERYLATNGDDGGIWMDAPCIILSTTGAKTGKLRRTPLIRIRTGDTYLVVASMGGAPSHPQWFHNMVANPDVVINDMAEEHHLKARVATPEEKAELWHHTTAVWPAYDEYQASTDRDIPLVICEPA